MMLIQTVLMYDLAKQQDINKDEIRADKNMNGVFLVSNEKSPSKIFQIQRRFCIKREMMV